MNGGHRESLYGCLSRPVSAGNRRAKSVSMTSRHTYPYGLLIECGNGWFKTFSLSPQMGSVNVKRLYWSRSKYLIPITRLQ